MLKKEEVQEAYKNIENYAKRTPILYSEAMKKELGFELMLKAENLQITNSFKIRGASNCILKRLKSNSKLKGVVTASSGNHGQAVAYVAYRLGLPTIIVVPETAPKAKVKAIKNWGAEIEYCGVTSEERKSRAKEIAKEKGHCFVSSFNDYDVMAGQGTAGKEILEQVPDADIVLVPIGGGGLISGISTYIKNTKPQIRVIGVEPKDSNSMGSSIKNGKVTRLEKTSSIADGLLVIEPGSLTYPIVEKYVDELITVEESEISDAIRRIMESYKVLAEPSGAVTLAAALGRDWGKGKKLVSLVSGGNYDVSQFCNTFQG